MEKNQIMIDDQIIRKPVNEIKPYLKNPRINQETVDLLVKIIPVVGFNQPIVIDTKGMIVKGHARYSAALKLGLTELPCIVSHASKMAIRADRLADNKIQEHTKWNKEMLREEVGDIDFESLGIDTSEFGFDELDTDLDIVSNEEVDGGEPVDNSKKSVCVNIHFILVFKKIRNTIGEGGTNLASNMLLFDTIKKPPLSP